MCVFRGVSCYFQTLHATLIYLKDSNALNAVFTINFKLWGFGLYTAVQKLGVIKIKI